MSASQLGPVFGDTIGFRLLPYHNPNQTDDWQAFRAVIYNISSDDMDSDGYYEVTIGLVEELDPIIPISSLYLPDDHSNPSIKWNLLRTVSSPKYFKFIPNVNLSGNSTICYYLMEGFGNYDIKWLVF